VVVKVLVGNFQYGVVQFFEPEPESCDHTPKYRILLGRLTERQVCDTWGLLAGHSVPAGADRAQFWCVLRR
jgi:hypothetical protein